MNVREAAARLEVSPSTVYGLVAAGKLKCCRVGMGRGVIRVYEEHIAEFIRGTEPPSVSVPAPIRRPMLKHVRIKPR